MKKIRCSIGVLAYNEEAIIGKLLNSLLNQELSIAQIEEIIVVSSASTDDTNAIVKEFSDKDKRIKLIAEDERRGKSAAINNFIKNTNTDVLIIESADTIPAQNTIEKLVKPFTNEEIGMTGGRPKPINKADNFIGYAVNLLWRLHHHMALREPKIGEMAAFRKVFSQIPPESAVDEASIESIIRNKGYEIKYIPDAIIKNKGPENLTDFIKQRRRIAAGHRWLKKTEDYSVSSSNSKLLFYLTLEEILANPLDIFKLFGVMSLEVYCRILGYYDIEIRNKNPYKWEIANTTKHMD